MSEQATKDPFGEQLSALMDGELPRDQLRFLLRRVDADAELVQRWSRYQIARSSLRRQPVPSLRLDFNAVLMQRIGQEALPIAGRRGAVVLRWVGGGAIAAAVAVVALVTTRPPQVENVPVAIVAAGAATTTATPISPAVSQDTRPPQSLFSPLANFDYAQPASFDPGAGFYTGAVPRYDLRRRYEMGPGGNVNSFLPYVLAFPPPRPQSSVPNAAEAPHP